MFKIKTYREREFCVSWEEIYDVLKVTIPLPTTPTPTRDTSNLEAASGEKTETIYRSMQAAHEKKCIT